MLRAAHPSTTRTRNHVGLPVAGFVRRLGFRPTGRRPTRPTGVIRRAQLANRDARRLAAKTGQALLTVDLDPLGNGCGFYTQDRGYVLPVGATGVQRAAARCWALLLVRIYECLPLLCLKCGEPMRIIAFVHDPPVIERILDHIGEPSAPPMILPARSPPQAEMEFSQVAGSDGWPEMDQTAGEADDTWE